MTTVRNIVTGKEHAFVGVADDGIGTHGTSKTSTGAGGVSGTGVGVHGVSTAGPGVRGDAEDGVGVFGASRSSTGTSGLSVSGTGCHGVSSSGDGLFGASETGRGVVGVASTATGVEGNSKSGAGIYGLSETGGGAVGVSSSGAGVSAISSTGEALHAETSSETLAAVAAYALNPASTGAAIYARSAGSKGDAAFFEGSVHITGICTVDSDVMLKGADLAEQFSLVGDADAEPGCVVVLAGDDTVKLSTEPYDRKVAGVVSGAGAYRPALVLDDRREPRRRPLALTGKVWCRVEADTMPVGVGDLLTTSTVHGYAMRATDQSRAFGAVVGKSLVDLPSGQALIPILVVLQ